MASQSYTLAAAARRMDVSENTLREWLARFGWVARFDARGQRVLWAEDLELLGLARSLELVEQDGDALVSMLRPLADDEVVAAPKALPRASLVAGLVEPTRKVRLPSMPEPFNVFPAIAGAPPPPPAPVPAPAPPAVVAPPARPRLQGVITKPTLPPARPVASLAVTAPLDVLRVREIAAQREALKEALRREPETTRLPRITWGETVLF